MKRKKVFLLGGIALVCGILLMATLSFGGAFYNMKKDAPKRSVEELKICFNQNEEEFKKAAVVINKNSGVITVQKKDFMAKSDNLLYYKTNDTLYFESKTQLSDDKLLEIASNVDYILNTLRFEKIFVQDGDIYFVEGSNLGMASGIVYVVVGDKPGDMYITNLEKITDKWFTFKAK